MATMEKEKCDGKENSVLNLSDKEKDDVQDSSKNIKEKEGAEKIMEETKEKEAHNEYERTKVSAKRTEDSAKRNEDSETESEIFYDAIESESTPSVKHTNSKENLQDTLGENEHTGDSEDEYEDEIECGIPDEGLTPEQKEERKIEAKQHKDQGNEYFRKSEYPEAKELYTRAIRICPSEFKNEKSVFYANRAACLVKMDQHKEAIEDCTKALDLNNEYLKARLRRAQCYEHVDKLEEALEDYQKVFDCDRSSHVAREALMRLPEEIKIKHEKMKEEMMGKLKDLGNVFLKPFGLSTNNFKLQQDPASGGYSINFQK